ncbi:MAG: 30S ribosomal protein S27ae [Nanoarchaeota archaeon]|nr:30S ribosomal protein S27ae [Nanoarchaeota archaeon]
MAEEQKQKIKKKKTSQKYKLYEVSGNTLKRKNKFCPKCGPGVFLSQHSDREYCGQCGYVEMKSKEKPKEDKEPPKKDKK